jgi:hypothetical protein
MFLFPAQQSGGILKGTFSSFKKEMINLSITRWQHEFVAYLRITLNDKREDNPSYL